VPSNWDAQFGNDGEPAMTSSDPTTWPAYVISREIGARRLSPIDLVAGLLDRIRNADPKLRAFVDVYADDACLAAEAAHNAIQSGDALGPLHGIPVALKDLVEVAGKKTTAGSLAWQSRRSEHTAALANRLISRGLIVLGKTHTTEFALGAWGVNQRMGTPWNPWDRYVHRAPGGSSSGSAVAVAAHMVPWAVGTDTGGSVRVPAAWCGLTGLKTTKGVVSTHGILSLSGTLDTPGPLTRCVEDAALLFYAMQDGDSFDPHGNPLPILKRGVDGMRLGRVGRDTLAGTSTEIATNYEVSLDLFGKLGATIIPIPWPNYCDYRGAISTVILAEAHASYGPLATDPFAPLDEFTRAELGIASRISATDYHAAFYEQQKLRRDFAAVFDDVDALLTPTVRMAAPTLDEIDRREPPTDFTRLVNFAQLCAISVPNGFTANGLPTSLQVICPPHAESTALRIGWAHEDATDWHLRMPPK
jgi:aspartyl-tRNA(Asn)/glutamyl-tRNA(Gln) amidotransferase subunit A